MKRFVACVLIFCFLTIPQAARAHDQWPGLSAALSIVVPGLGQVKNGDHLEGLVWFSSVAGAVLFGGRLGQSIGFDLWMYQVYDAYRDEGPHSGRFQKHNVFENYLGNFNPLNFVDPISAPIVSVGIYSGKNQGTLGKSFHPRNILKYSFVGLGEEGLFRGFLYPAMTDVFFGSTVVGAIVSSAIFGLVHFQYNMGQRAWVAGLGLLWCIQTSYMDYDLRRSIFSHSWYDIFVAPAYDRSRGRGDWELSTVPLMGGVKFYF